MYHLHAKDFPDYKIWLEILQFIPMEKPIIDIGCGVGMFAELCNSTGHNYEVGYDFSHVAIHEAMKRVPGTKFENKDFNSDSLPKHSGCAVLFLEVLEHLENDLQLLKRMAPGNDIFITVPNFESESHVRSFENLHDALNRYGKIISVEHTNIYPVSDENKIFLIHGAVRKEDDEE